MLWILDASINVSMEPFRALVGDMLPDRQRASRLFDAELVHRRRRGGRVRAAVAACQHVRRQQRRGARPAARNRSSLRSTSALPRSSARCCGRCSRPASIRRPSWPRSRATAVAPAHAHGVRAHAGAVPQVRRRLDRWRASRFAALVAASAGTSSSTCSVSASRPSARCSSSPAAGSARQRRTACCTASSTISYLMPHGDAAARGGAVPVVVRAVRDVDLHDRGGHRRTTTARPTQPRPPTTRAPTGSACCSRPTTALPRSPRW